MRRFYELSIFQIINFRHFYTIPLEFNQNYKTLTFFSLGMLEYGDGTQTVRQTTRGKLITFDPKFNEQRNNVALHVHMAPICKRGDIVAPQYKS